MKDIRSRRFFLSTLYKCFGDGLVGGIVAKAKKGPSEQWLVKSTPGRHSVRLLLLMTWVLRQGNVTLLLRLTFFVCMCDSNPALQRAVPPASLPATSQVRALAAMPTATLGEITLGNQSRPVPGLTKPTYYPLLFSVRVCGLLCNRVVSLYAWASAPGCGCQLFMRLFPRET